MGYAAVLASPQALPDRWYGTDGIAELSEEEADTLSGTLATEFARHSGIEAEKEPAMREALRRTLAQAMKTYQGDPAVVSIEGLIDEVRSASERHLTDTEVRSLVAWLKAKLA